MPAPDDGAVLDLPAEAAAALEKLDAMGPAVPYTDRELLGVILVKLDALGERLDALQSDVDGFKLLGEQLAAIGSKGLPGMLSGLLRSAASSEG